jgi:Asp-tRNA(Asn)/Glu-tRNA(Gln) amidotransferase A subunit family amidase
MNGLPVLPAVELLSMLRRGQISPLELAREYIEQIERLNPQLNALVDFDAERVREQARALENSTGARGPLFGLPMTIKSSIATAGYRCELGSLLHRGHIPSDPGHHQLPGVSHGV